jgi:serine/threonine-protein kinase
MGIVYRAHDLRLERDVALKVIAPHLVQEEIARARFLREAQTTAALSHPNIVTVYDLVDDTTTNAVCIVMELLHGAPLRQLTFNPKRPSFLTVAVQTARALECAHSHNLLHRDIKPENVFVCSDGTLKLMDFGLARLLGSDPATRSTVMAGTVYYMAPEQLRGDVLDGRTDLYALGVLLYEYLAGVPPFIGDNPGAILHKHLTEPPPPLRAKLPTLPVELETIVMRLLQKEPNARYPSAQALREAVERLQAADGGRARETPGEAIPLTTPTKPSKPRPQLPPQVRVEPRFGWRSLLALGLVALAIGAGAYFYGPQLYSMIAHSAEQNADAKGTAASAPKPNRRSAAGNTARREQDGRNRNTALFDRSLTASPAPPGVKYSKPSQKPSEQTGDAAAHSRPPDEKHNPDEAADGAKPTDTSETETTPQDTTESGDKGSDTSSGDSSQ